MYVNVFFKLWLGRSQNGRLMLQCVNNYTASASATTPINNGRWPPQFKNHPVPFEYLILLYIQYVR